MVPRFHEKQRKNLELILILSLPFSIKNTEPLSNHYSTMVLMKTSGIG